METESSESITPTLEFLDEGISAEGTCVEIVKIPIDLTLSPEIDGPSGKPTLLQINKTENSSMHLATHFSQFRTIVADPCDQLDEFSVLLTCMKNLEKLAEKVTSPNPTTSQFVDFVLIRGITSDNMSFDYTDVGGLTQRLSEIFYDQALGDISASLPENEGTLTTTEDQLKDEPKYGDCYIFDYQEFQNGSKTRPGSEKDVARLRHDFIELNFNVYSSYLNLTKQDTLNTLKEAANKVHKESKCFVCCFLTHGSEGELLMKDRYLKIEDILKCFSRSACKNLAGIPKIFIFQACRGHCCEEGVCCDSTDFGSKMDIPDYLDFLLVYSTYEGKYSFKTKDDERLENNHGSFFIDELCRTLEQFSGESDLLQILTIVNYRVAHLYLSNTKEEETNRKKQMPGFTSRLTTKVEFNRPIQMFVSPDTEYFDCRRRMSSLGLRSTNNPLEDKKIYNIQKSRIKFVLLLNTENNFGSNLADCASDLWSSVAARSYQRDLLEHWSKSELRDFLKKVAVQDCSNTDCLICFVACQAKGDYMCDNKGNKFEKREVVEKFTGKACKDLRGKPKIFIFLTSSSSKKSWWPWSCVYADSTDGDDNSMIPVHSDLLELTIAIQEIKQLQGVMEKFCNIFGNKSSEDFVSQLTRMNDELVKDYEFFSPSSKKLSTFCFNSTLTETLILNKPKCESK
ncbi:Caspase-3 [Araneus ventricosus]|uniref:Caspase-3 n=1 Tax=Araneus ventricosus TaxID=182803 RepID=A0A4Y2FV63_ARAVE|nr:Caspase-3 [Araneus ventricosus]